MYDLLDLQRCAFPVPPYVFTTCSTVHCWILTPDNLHLLCVLTTCSVIFRTLRVPHHLWHGTLGICSMTRQSPRQLHHSCRRFARIISVTRHIMSSLHGSNFTLLAHNNASCATPRHARRCLLLQSLRISEHQLRTQLDFLKQHMPPIPFRITVADPSNGITSILTSQDSGLHTGPSREKQSPPSMHFTTVLILGWSRPLLWWRRLRVLRSHRQRRSPRSSHRRPHP